MFAGLIWADPRKPPFSRSHLFLPPLCGSVSAGDPPFSSVASPQSLFPLIPFPDYLQATLLMYNTLTSAHMRISLVCCERVLFPVTKFIPQPFGMAGLTFFESVSPALYARTFFCFMCPPPSRTLVSPLFRLRYVLLIN